MWKQRLACLVLVMSVLGLALSARAAEKAAKPYSRFCKQSDVIGTWHLVKFSTPYQFKDPQAPYLLPHQLFQFAKDGSMKSAHSAAPFQDDPGKVFKGIPVGATFAFEKEGLVTLKAKGATVGSETWHCVTITQDKKDDEHQVHMKRGDLVMTLIGKKGEPAFTRQLRKGAA